MSAILALCAGYASAQPGKKAPASPKAQAHSSKPHASSHSSKSRRTRKGAWKRHGQQGIQPERARAIQEALIREKYLTGEPNGQWDARTKEAMAHYQTVNGWQSKVTPDSRALIKLGLGPNYSDKDMLKLDSKATNAAGPNEPANGATSSKQR